MPRALLASFALVPASLAEPIGPNAFGTDTDRVEFAALPEGTELAFQHAVQGARLRCDDGRRLRVAAAPGANPDPVPARAASAPAGDCTVEASFWTPRRRVGVWLAPPDGATVVTLTAFDAAGHPLDTAVLQQAAAGPAGFLGIGIAEPAIARVALTATPATPLVVGALLAEPSQATGVGSLAAHEQVLLSPQASDPARIAALDAVRRAPSPQARALLEKVLADAAHPYLQELAAEALAQLGDRAALPQLEAALAAATDRELVLGLHNAAWHLRELHPPLDAPAVACRSSGPAAAFSP